MQNNELTDMQRKTLANRAAERKRIDRTIKAMDAANEGGTMTRQRERALDRAERKATRSQMKKRTLNGSTKGGAAVIRALPA